MSETTTDETIPQRIRRYREELGLTVAEAAENAGLSACRWSDVENGTKEPTLDVLVGMSWVLAVDLIDLVKGPQLVDFTTHATKSLDEFSVDEQNALLQAQERLAWLMNLDRWLRESGIGEHHIQSAEIEGAAR